MNINNDLKRKMILGGLRILFGNYTKNTNVINNYKHIILCNLQLSTMSHVLYFLLPIDPVITSQNWEKCCCFFK